MIIFVIYFVFDNMGYKLARDGRAPVWEGIWLSSFVILPMGIFFTYKAVGDSAMFDIESYKKAFRRFFGISERRLIALKEVAGFKYSAAGVEQEVAFVADGDVDAEIPLLLEKIDYLVAEMMHIHHYVGDAARYDIANYAFEHSHAGEFYERLGRVVGERMQSSAKSGCKYYCFHFFT